MSEHLIENFKYSPQVYTVKVNLSQNFSLRGVVPNPFAPSISLLMFDFDVTGIFSERGSDFMSFQQGLQDLLNELDQKYAKHVKMLRGRGVEIKARTFQQKVAVNKEQTKFKTVKQRGRYIDVMPYPSAFASTISDIRTKFYKLIQHHGAITLSSYTIGRRVFKTYFLREEDASALKVDVAKLNESIDKLNNDISSFEQTSRFSRILNYIKNEVPVARWSRMSPFHSEIHHCMLNFSPMPLSKELIEMYADNEVKAEIRKNIHNSVEKIATDFQKRLGSWAQDIATSLLRDINTGNIIQAEQALDKVKRGIDEYQLGGILGKQVGLCDSLLKAIETKDEDTIALAARDFAEANGVTHTTQGTPAGLLREASLNMVEASPEVRALIEAML